MSWSDAGLTLKGYEQSLEANKFWKDALKTTKTPVPATFYTSPLLRSLITVNLTFSALPIWTAKPFTPMVKEISSISLFQVLTLSFAHFLILINEFQSLRGIIIACTCAWRHSKSWIHKNFPNYVL